jgi:hypothetical protein
MRTNYDNKSAYWSTCKMCQEFDNAITALATGLSTVAKLKLSLHETTWLIKRTKYFNICKQTRGGEKGQMESTCSQPVALSQNYQVTIFWYQQTVTVRQTQSTHATNLTSYFETEKEHVCWLMFLYHLIKLQRRVKMKNRCKYLLAEPPNTWKVLDK